MAMTFGYFNPMRIGDFNPMKNGQNHPMLTPECEHNSEKGILFCIDAANKDILVV